MTAAATPGSAQNLVDIGVLHLCGEPMQEVFLERLAGQGGATTEFCMHVGRDIFDLNAGHGHILAP
jgi:hypothetical protein